MDSPMRAVSTLLNNLARNLRSREREMMDVVVLPLDKLAFHPESRRGFRFAPRLLYLILSSHGRRVVAEINRFKEKKEALKESATVVSKTK